MFNTCGVLTRGHKNSESSSNGGLQSKIKNQSSNPWKFAFSLTGRRCTRTQNVKNSNKGRNHRGGKELTRIDDDLLGLSSTLNHIMKQISSIKRKITHGKKAGETVGRKQQEQQQNGQQPQQLQPKKKVKKSLGKKTSSTDTQIKNKLNVNERPIRKKKKTKKYESYERNGKSPEPEVKQETNLLLALGLTPVKKDGKAKLNRMHIMEERNAKVAADTAELPQTQADLPKTSSIVGDAPEIVISSDATDSSPKSPTLSASKVNGVADEEGEKTPGRKNSLEKIEPRKEEEEDAVSSIRISSTSTLSGIEVKKEPEGKAEESEEVERNEKEREKSSEPHDLTVTCVQNFENACKTSQNEKHYPNNKIISISVEQCQTNSSSVNSVSDEVGADKLKKPKPITGRKRSNKSTDSEESYKANCKRTKFPEMVDHEDRERTVSEYVEKASGFSLEELQMNTEKLQQEIHSLSALARAKELEWNDIIRLKKVKEEIYLRLVRRKQVMLLSMGGSGRMSDSVNWDFASDNRMTDFVTNDEVTYNRVAPSVSPKPPPRLPSNLTITKSQSSPSQNLQRFLMQPQGSSDPKNTSLMMVPIVSSTPISLSSSSPYLPRTHLGTPLKIPIPDREKLKVANNRNAPVPILPKPNQNINHAVNNHSPPIGRQGPIVDVKSIIADYRQNHPEQVPRRGRRPKGQPSQNFAETMVSSGRGVLSMSSLALGSGAQVRTVNSNSDLVAGSAGQSAQETSRPSSADSNRSVSNAPSEVASASGVSFKDVLVQFAKMSQHQQTGDRRNSTPPAKSHGSSKAPPYPEVTLHPVIPAGAQSPPNPSSSLLHGILTKSNGASGSRGDGQSTSRSTTFSPTLARLLTTPDRSSLSTTITTALRGSGTSTTASRVASGPVSIADLLSTSKPAKMKDDVGNGSDEDPDDNADRLVIDESEEQEARNGDEEEMDGETVPECQGCHMKSAQFVCAGCGNQWYCSRNCQVTAWDEHSEVCSG